jgi:hypothetical protein
LKQLRIAVLYSCVLFACSASISLLNMVFGDKYEKFARKNISVSYPDKQIWTEIDGHSKLPVSCLSVAQQNTLCDTHMSTNSNMVNSRNLDLMCLIWKNS